jgi:hypothetical protein
MLYGINGNIARKNNHAPSNSSVQIWKYCGKKGSGIFSSKARIKTQDPIVKNAPEIMQKIHVAASSKACRAVSGGTTKK